MSPRLSSFVPIPFLNVKAIVTVRSSSDVFSIDHINTAHGKELS